MARRSESVRPTKTGNATMSCATDMGDLRKTGPPSLADRGAAGIELRAPARRGAPKELPPAPAAATFAGLGGTHGIERTSLAGRPRRAGGRERAPVEPALQP